MGLFKREKRVYEDIPDDQLDWNQRALKKYMSPEPFYVDSGKAYNLKHREQINVNLHQNLGLSDLDDLLQMKAPRFYDIYTQGIKNLNNLCDYVGTNLPANNKLQQLKGQYDELQKRCEYQETLIKQLMEQNEKLQNQILDKTNVQSSTFSR